ncbi:hypothetical protein Tco_0553729, partial [Tanacetum coccineum]
VADNEDTIIFKLDSQVIIYTVNIFRDTLQLPVETPDNPFITPITIKTIESFMQTIGYQGIVDKYPSIPQRLDEYYHSIKDDIPLVNVYSTGNVLFRGMRIPAAFLTNEIRATDDYKEYETVFVGVDVPMNQPQPIVSTQGTHRTTPRAHRTPTITVASPQGRKRNQTDLQQKLYSKMKRSLQDQANDPTLWEVLKRNITPRVLGTLRRICKSQGNMIRDMERKCVTNDEFWKVQGKVDQVLHKTVPQIVEKATNDLIESNLKRVVADTVIQERDAFQAEVPTLISKEFDTHAPMIIEELFKQYVQHNVIQVHPTTTTSTDTTSSADLQQQLYSKMKRSLQDQANDPALWEALKRNFEKSSTSNTSCRDDDFHSQHPDDDQDDDAPTEGEKRVKRHKVSKSSKSARGSSSKRSAKESITYVTKQQQHQQQEWDAWEEEIVIDEYEVIPEDKTPELIIKLQNVDKRVPTMFDRARMEVTLNDMFNNQF